MAARGDFDAQVAAWFSAVIPPGWFTGPVQVVSDGDEVAVTGDLAAPPAPDGMEPELVCARVIARFRTGTRNERIAIAAAAEERLQTKVSWAVTCGPLHETFTQVTVPVMTRLRMAERAVLDTLVEASVARSRSEALAWCVRLVADHQGEWIDELRDAMVRVEEVRTRGPRPGE